MRRTKIVCTIGPATDSETQLEKLIDAGMNVARLNFSHGTQEEHKGVIERIRKISLRKDVPVAILQDLAGPKIRTGVIEPEPIALAKGQVFVLTSDKIKGNAERVSVNYPKLPDEVKAGDQILLADASIELVVKEIAGTDIRCEVLVGGMLSSKKGINLPGRSLSVDALTAKDISDLEFGLDHDVDYIAMSFVRSREDIRRVLKIMERKKKGAPIVAKIEKHEALDNIDQIIEIVDGVMVARGDLAVEVPLEKVPLYQKWLIRKSNEACIPVITATQMLKSMVDNPRPTRAEANDVANAVIDGTDAVMLSEETAIGKYPIEAVQTMARIIDATESSKTAERQRLKPDRDEHQVTIAQAVSHAACEMAEVLNAGAIITPTQAGSTARIISSYRPKLPIIALSPDEAIIRRLSLVWGVLPLISDGYFNSDEMMERAKDKAIRSGAVNPGDVVIITAGMPIGVPGTTNLIKAEVLR
jgi:pyruvate kinase